MRELHLVCNAHIDPCWQWDIEEGIAAAVSTFRCAADFCDEYPALIFNHNEALLYQWIEYYEPELFERIKKLIEQGRWHIMGGWYLQPDCNLPSGESFVRQILKGRIYFKKKFGVCPKTAMNVDSFGHTRGLVQILHKSGYDSYIFCRPFKKDLVLKNDDFIWRGYDGSEIIGFRMFGIYNSLYGMACTKIKEWLENFPEKETGCVFWGVGNHGGGPSRADLDEISRFIDQEKNINIFHSTPENYFKKIKDNKKRLPVWNKGLNHWGRGCYTSMARIKQKHRQLENEYYKAEKMAACAEINENIPYPKKELDEALKALLFSEFHDILPGSAVKSVEETGIRKLEYGLEITRRLCMNSFMGLSSGQPKADNGTIPILIYNPHPYMIEDIFECEFMLANMNVSGTFKNPIVYDGKKRLKSQCEKEESNFPMDWRKKVVFKAKLLPFTMNRFDCRLEDIESELTKSSKDMRALADSFLNPDKAQKFDFDGVKLPLKLPLGKPVQEMTCVHNILKLYQNGSEVNINMEKGVIETIKTDGHEILGDGGLCPIVVEDTMDSWAVGYTKFDKIKGIFAKKESYDKDGIPNVQIVENGEVRTVVEALLQYGKSVMSVVYKIPKNDKRIDVEIRVNWFEKDSMLKIAIPYQICNTQYCIQTSYGHETAPKNGDEVYMQQWCGVFNENNALAVINEGIYGSSCDEKRMYLSLLRSPAYAAHPSPVKELKSQTEYRHIERMDQGERLFKFSIIYGETLTIRKNIDRWAQIKNEKPMVLSYFPDGSGIRKKSALYFLKDTSIQMTCFKKAEADNGYILRLFEPLGIEENATIVCPLLEIEQEVKLKAFEIKTFLCRDHKLEEISLMEEA